METYNSLGFTNFWGVTPAYDILLNENNESIKKLLYFTIII